MPHSTSSFRPEGRDPLAAWCSLFEGCTRIADLVPRQPATALGVVHRIRLVPGESMEAVVSDGSGRLRAVWTSADPLQGLELGRGLRLEGTVCMEAGHPVMRNPTWCVVRDPYACAEQLAAEAHRAAARSGEAAVSPR